jgi:hypothetical protein
MRQNESYLFLHKCYELTFICVLYQSYILSTNFIKNFGVFLDQHTYYLFSHPLKLLGLIRNTNISLFHFVGFIALYQHGPKET